MVLEAYSSLVYEIPILGLGIWHLETVASQPTFRLLALNHVAKERISPVEIEVGKTINESLKEPHNKLIAEFFANVLITGKSAFVDEFSLDGKASFSIHAFPLKRNCVAVSFDQCKSIHLKFLSLLLQLYPLNCTHTYSKPTNTHWVYFIKMQRVMISRM